MQWRVAHQISDLKMIYLMAAHKQVQAVVLQEALRDICAKGNADAALAVRAPAARLRVAPQQLAHQALFWWLSAGGHGEVRDKPSSRNMTPVIVHPFVAFTHQMYQCPEEG